MTDFNIDSIAKTSSQFPKPESRTILVDDGWGSRYHREILPASLLCCVMKPVGKVEIPSLFGDKIIASGVLFQIPDHMRLEYNPNRLYQTLKDGDRNVLEMLYDRDYNQIRIKLSICGGKPIPPQPIYDNIPGSGKCRYTEDQEWVQYNDAFIPEDLTEEYWGRIRQALLTSFNQTN